jgi:hypothetical protein
MDAVLHRIEALPGEERYAVSFARSDGSEQTSVFSTGAADAGVDGVQVAAASLPDGWTPGSAAFSAAAVAVLAVRRARAMSPPAASLYDLDGGWDVSLGNVVLSADGRPECSAHGDLLLLDHGVYECPQCGARAGYTTPL